MSPYKLPKAEVSLFRVWGTGMLNSYAFEPNAKQLDFVFTKVDKKKDALHNLINETMGEFSAHVQLVNSAAFSSPVRQLRLLGIGKIAKRVSKSKRKYSQDQKRKTMKEKKRLESNTSQQN